MLRLGILTPLTLLVLTGCGSDSDSNNSVQNTTLTALDGYLENAQVYVDTNANKNLDSDDELLGLTKTGGKFEMSAVHSDKTLFVKAIAGQTLDTDRGMVTQDFILASQAGSKVVSPMTNAVMDIVVEESLSFEAAQKKVALSFKELTDDTSLIFGDYLLDSSSTSQALKVIGEQLVDNSTVSAGRQTELIEQLSDDLNSEIQSNNGQLDSSYYPSVSIPSDSTQAIQVESNHKPMIVKPLEDVSMTLGDAFNDLDISAHFSDKEGDVLAYEITEKNKVPHNLTISAAGIISGNVSKAGDYHFEVVAIDSKKVRSYPLALNVQVAAAADNEPPVLDENELKRLQDDIMTWELTDQYTIDDTIDVSSLFTDSDNLTFRAESTLELDPETGEKTDFEMFWYQDGTTLGFNSGPSREAQSGVETITIFANDGVNIEEATATFSLPTIAAFPGYSTPHFLMDSYWYWTSSNEGYGLVCSLAYFDESESKAYLGKRSVTDASQCAEPDMDNLDLDNPIAFERTSYHRIESLNFANDGIAWEVHSFSWDGNPGSGTDKALLTYTEYNSKAQKIETEAITFYQDPDFINGVMEQQVSIDVTSPIYAETELGFIDASGHSSEIKIEAAIQENTSTSGETKTLAMVRSAGTSACKALKEVYRSSFSVFGPSPTLIALPVFEEKGRYCYIKLEAEEGEMLTQGTYFMRSFPFNPAGHFYESLYFSFKYE
ncbi:hypothetical protein [Vibrio sp.]|uniref:hypothetical protein n=1 Tax=Vibrio sp. TaxID=678 RepID=UPI003F6CD146